MTATKVCYPGPRLPAVPSFTVMVPEGWAAHAAAGLLAVVEPAEPHEPFQPNLTVAADLLDADTDPAQVVNRLAVQVAMVYPGTRFGTRDAMPTTDGMAVATQHLSIAAPASTVEQVIAVYLLPAPEGSLTHAYTVVSSWQEQNHGVALRHIHESFRIHT